MLKERAKTVAYWVWLTDVLLTVAAFLLAWWVRSHLGPRLFPGLFPTELYPLTRYLGLLALIIPIWTVLFLTREAYTSRRMVSLSAETWHVLQVVSIGVLSLAAAGWLLRSRKRSSPTAPILRRVIWLAWAASSLSLCCCRFQEKTGPPYWKAWKKSTASLSKCSPSKQISPV